MHTHTHAHIHTHTHTQLSGGFNRELVKDGLVVELSDGIRKIRRVFLFHDVLVCSKQKPSRWVARRMVPPH